ncbi:uncharacterized protein LOC134241865, partial [Saccostrea cucullata]|uniref:uncharacterized protein LOC134241865 n=1 Tax=Saccostrea cuccullata TaxID=36930 RepID=UPI002ED31460
RDPKFSDVCGENIELSKNRKIARWRHTYSAGRLFASRQMFKDENLEVVVDGSGHVGIGIIKTDPGTLKDLREGATSACKPKLVTDIRVHKREGLVKIKLREEDKATKLDITYSGQKVVVKVNKDEKFWLTFELKFGSAVIKFKSPDISFHQNAGRNISFLDKERRSAKLDVEYPAVTCCLWRKLRVNEYVIFSVLPLKDGEKDPSTYYMVLGASQLEPVQLRSRDPESFKADSRAPTPSRWKVINRFDKDVCYGEVRVGIGPNGRIRAFHSSGFETEMDFDPQEKSSQCLFVLSLFRTEVRIKEFVEEETLYDYALKSFRKASRKCQSDSVYIDVIDDNTPVNYDIQNKQGLRCLKSKSFPMANPTQGDEKERQSLTFRPREPSDNYYDDVALGNQEGTVFSDDTSQIDAVYCDVIGEGHIDDSESNLTLSPVHKDSVKSERHYDEILINNESSPKVAKKTNKSPQIIRKPVSLILDKVQGIKNVFTKRAEHPYDDVKDDEIKSDSVSKSLGTTLVSVPSDDVTIEENTYWEVQEVPRGEKEKETPPIAHARNNGATSSPSKDRPKETQAVKSIDTKEKENKAGVNELRERLESPQVKMVKSESESCISKSLSNEISNSDMETQNNVNVKLLIKKFGGNENEAGKVNSCALREKHPRTPLFHTSPSAPALSQRSNSDDNLALSRSVSHNAEPPKNESEAALKNKHKGSSDLANKEEKTCVLNETFDSINLLLNLGKGKKEKHKGKDKKK